MQTAITPEPTPNKKIITASVTPSTPTSTATPTANPSSTPLTNNNLIPSTTEEWVEVTHKNFCNNPRFANPDYKFANIAFSYPKQWKLDCLGHIENSFIQYIYSVPDDRSKPYIVITDIGLWACPSEKPDCSDYEENVKKTPKQQYQAMQKSISKDELVTIEKNKKTLKNLKLPALEYIKSAYKGYQDHYDPQDPKNQTSISYLFATDTNVIEISFVNYTDLTSEFREAFLDKLKYDK